MQWGCGIPVVRTKEGVFKVYISTVKDDPTLYLSCLSPMNLPVNVFLSVKTVLSKLFLMKYFVIKITDQALKSTGEHTDSHGI